MSTTLTTSHDVILANRKAWLEALRSGRFEQTQTRLYDGDGYCCLGVASVLCGLEPVEAFDHDGMPAYLFGEADEALVLPREGMEWLGLADPNPILDIGPLQAQGTEEYPNDNQYVTIPTDVATLNDQGLTFSQIADLIDYFGFTRFSDALQW